LEYGEITFEELVEGLAKTGLDPEWIERVARAYYSFVMREEVMGLVREAITDYKEGWIVEAEFRERLRDLGIPDARIEYYLARAESAFQREYREELVDIYITAFRQGLIDPFELKEALRRLGMREERIDAIIWKEELRKAPKRKS